MWSFNPIKKKVEDKDLVGKIQVKVGISNKSLNAKKLSDELGVAIIEYIKKKEIKNVVVYQREFSGYEGDKPTLEILIPNVGAVMFGNMNIEEGLKLIYTIMIPIKNL